MAVFHRQIYSLSLRHTRCKHRGIHLIKQNAHSIKGRIVLAKMNDNKQVFDLKNFRFSGEFYNNFLNITCWNEDKRQIGTHNYLMQIERDGKEMEGFKTYFDIGLKKIQSDEVYWSRSNTNTN
jgi:hypothetical protein